METPDIRLAVGAVIIFAAFAALAYFSTGDTDESGAYYSPSMTDDEVGMCPASCHYYSVGSGEGRVDVGCEVAKKYVNTSMRYCPGIESYTMDREKICACPSIRDLSRSEPSGI